MTERPVDFDCVFHSSSGFHCPGCGFQRAVHRLSKGDLLGAFRLNPLLVVLLPALVYYGLPLLWNLVRHNRYQEIPMPTWLTSSLAVLIVLFFIARNLPWFPFTLLAPS